MEKAKSNLDLVDLSKQNFRKTLDSIQEGAHSLLLLSVHWKEIEGHFDSTKTILKDRANELQVLDESIKNQAKVLETKEKELQALEESLKNQTLVLETKEKELQALAESIKGQILKLEAKEKELQALEETLKGQDLVLEAKKKDLCLINESFKAKLIGLDKKRKTEIEQFESLKSTIESLERYSYETLNKLEAKANGLEMSVKEAKKLGEEVNSKEKPRVDQFEPLVSLLAKSIGISVKNPYNNCSEVDLATKNSSLSRLVPYLDPSKIVLDSIEASLKEQNKKECEESVVNSCIVLLEKLMESDPKIPPKVKEDATKLGIELVEKAKTNPENHPRVLVCLLFLAAYGLIYVASPYVLLNLLDRVLLYHQAPILYRLLGLEDKVYGVVETLRKNEEYFAVIRFICDLKFFSILPGALLLKSLNLSAQCRSENSMETRKAKREKLKDNLVMALEYIKEKKLECKFPLKAIRRLIVGLKSDETPKIAMKPVYSERKIAEKHEENKAKRQKLIEPITHVQDSTVNQLEDVADPPGQLDTKTNIGSASINADMLRKLLENQSLEESNLSNALKCTPDSAKLALDTSMALYPTKREGGYEFKLLVTSSRLSLLLDNLKKLMPQIGHPLKGDSKKLAVYWKDKLLKSKTDNLEVVCFLKFVGVYGIVSEFKPNDLLCLLDSPYWRSVSPDLCEFLGLDKAIPDFIQNLIKTGRRLKAIEYIYSFNMVHRFQPVSGIIRDFLRITNDVAEKLFKEAKNESKSQVVAIDRQIRSLRAAIRCISSHKLDSELQIENLQEHIKSLLKLRENTLSKPNLDSKQTQTAKPQNLETEVCSIPSNTPNESSSATGSSTANKPYLKNRGRKRTFSGNIHSPAYVSSDPSNQFRGHSHGYSMEQRLGWSAHSGYLEPGFDSSQLTQAKPSHFYQSHQQF